MKTYRYFYELMRFRPRYYLTDIISATIHFALSTVLGLILRGFFNGLTGEPGFSLTLWQTLAAQVGQTLLVLVTLYIAVMAAINFEQHGMALLVRNMFARLLQMPGSKALPTTADGGTMSTGKVISTLRDDTQEMMSTVIIWDDFVATGVTAVVSLAIMLQINVLVTIGTFLPLAAVVFIAQRLGEHAREIRKRSRAATAEVTGMIADMFNATQAVKVANAEERIIGRFRQVNDSRREAMVKDRLLTQMVDSLSSGAVDMGVGLVLLFAAQSMYSGAFTVGDFALFAAYIWPVTHFMRTVGNLIARYKQVDVSVQRMEVIMQTDRPGTVVAHNPIYLTGPLPELPFTPKSERLEALRIANLTYRYDGEHGIEDVSFTVPRGSFTVVTGRIGSGKSTLLKVLLGLLPPDAGAVYWNGERVADPRTFFAPPRAAYTGQVPRLFSESLRDNILLGLPPERVDLEGAVATAVFSDDVAGMDHGLDTLVGPRGVRLSGGQIQRAAAARMFVRDAELLVFDDLSSALDVETERRLWQGVVGAGNDLTCLVVSHRRPALRRADQIVVMENGRVADVGTLEELLPRCEEMRRLWQGEWA